MQFSSSTKVFVAIVALVTGIALCAARAADDVKPNVRSDQEAVRSAYVLGPEDQILVRVPEAEDLSEKTFRIGASGYITLPLVGRVRAGGQTVEQLERELTSRLKSYIQEPQVSLSVVEFKSQPVSVIGSVKTPGVYQLEGRRSLVEVLSLAGGLREDAGHSVTITRLMGWGRLPLATAKVDPNGEVSVAEVSLKSVLEARNPQDNLAILPRDIISVPRAQMVYVIGDVAKAGGYVLNERETVTALQALALAGGMNRTAAPQRAKIIRPATDSTKRTEILLDLKGVLASKAEDPALRPDDILFVPNSTGKTAALRSLEAVIGMGAQIGSGVVVYRRY